MKRVLKSAAKVQHFSAGCWASTPNNYGEGVFLAPTGRDVPGQTPLTPPLKGGEKFPPFKGGAGRVFRGVLHLFHLFHLLHRK